MLASFLYIAQGRIFLKEPDQQAKPIESVFAQNMVDRAQQIRQRNAWKTQGFGARFMSGRMPWNNDPDDDQAEIPVVINAVSRGTHDGEILYSLASGEIGGLFSIERTGQNERRILHTADFRISELNASAAEGKIACVIRTKIGSHIAVMRSDGGELSDVTQGDALDASPVWASGTTHELIFQSAGIARSIRGGGRGLSQPDHEGKH